MKLNLGAGRSGDGDWKIDLYKFDEKTLVVDLVVEPLPFADNYFDEVEAKHLLEHIPTQLRWKTGMEWHVRFPRVELMREVHRVLKPGGVFHIATPYDWPEWAQDPTHVDVPWTLETFDYFCGYWGGNQEGSEQKEAYLIDFQFEREGFTHDTTNHQLLVTLKKPNENNNDC